MNPFVISALLSLLANLIWWWIGRRLLSNKVGRILCDHMVVVLAVLFILYSGGLLRFSAISSAPLPEDGKIAFFSTDCGTNDFGEEWADFNDNKLGGRSAVIWSVVKEGNSDNNYLQMEFSIKKGRTDPYCGVYSFLSDHPVCSRDLRRWNAIQLRCKGTWQEKQNVHFFVQIATLGIKDYAFYEAELTFLKGKNEWTSVTVPFDRFHQPYWKTTQAEPFDLSKVFKVAFYVRADDGAQGVLCLDDIRCLRL